MKITSLVENQTKSELKTTHGLSLFIETDNHKILFDLGPDNTLFDNAKTRGIDLSEVDTVIISHGHSDHGGALEVFLEMNTKAKVYVQKKAFLPHFGKFLIFKKNIGLNEKLQNHPQIVLVDGDYQIDNELLLFTVATTKKCHSKANDSLYQEGQKDEFLHEQNLIISENKISLIMGCGHTGVVNILEKAAKFNPLFCIGGYHLFNPARKKTEPDTLLNAIINELQKYKDIKFYTCHCTGEKAFKFLSERMPNMFYLSCGDTIEI